MRGPKFDKSGLKKGSWSAKEDQKLVAFIKRYGIWNWTLVPKYADLPRTGKSCRLRWVNYLCPTIRRGNITKEEEDIIVSLHQTLGNRWSTIASRLPGRTDNEIKNYWHGHLKKRVNDDDNTNINASNFSNSESSFTPKSPYTSVTKSTPSSCSSALTFELDDEQKMEDLEVQNTNNINNTGENGNLDQFFWEELDQNSCMKDDISAFIEPKLSQECWYQEPSTPYDFNTWDSIFNTLMEADMISGDYKEPNNEF